MATVGTQLILTLSPGFYSTLTYVMPSSIFPSCYAIINSSLMLFFQAMRSYRHYTKLFIYENLLMILNLPHAMSSLIFCHSQFFPHVMPSSIFPSCYTHLNSSLGLCLLMSCHYIMFSKSCLPHAMSTCHFLPHVI